MGQTSEVETSVWWQMIWETWISNCDWGAWGMTRLTLGVAHAVHNPGQLILPLATECISDWELIGGWHFPQLSLSHSHRQMKWSAYYQVLEKRQLLCCCRQRNVLLVASIIHLFMHSPPEPRAKIHPWSSHFPLEWILLMNVILEGHLVSTNGDCSRKRQRVKF